MTEKIIIDSEKLNNPILFIVNGKILFGAAKLTINNILLYIEINPINNLKLINGEAIDLKDINIELITDIFYSDDIRDLSKLLNSYDGATRSAYLRRLHQASLES